MSRSLHSLLRSVGIKIPTDLKDLQIKNISCDSRLVKEGDFFIGLPGENFDGGVFWPKALSQGAIAAGISRNAARLCPPGHMDSVIILSEPVLAWAGQIAAEFWGHPSSKMSLIGVTGTNGKTTTTHLIEYLCRSIGEKTALFGTLVNRWPSHSEVAIHTTGFASTLHSQLAEAVQAGAKFGAMEVSSHSLAQSRVVGCKFSGAIFTNLTQDHLDYHSSMEAYFEANARLFEPSFFLSQSIKPIVNIDDEWGSVLAKRLNHNCWKCKLTASAKIGQLPDLFFSDLKTTAEGVEGKIHTPVGDGRFTSPLIGKFNLMNFLQAVGALIQLDLPLKSLLVAISDFEGVPGRMQRVKLLKEDYEYKLPFVFVDYAHTPDGLKNALVALRPLTDGDLICVFGCGGDRDKGKRSQMGAVAAQFADKLVVTSDNPRSEDPLSIINDIKLGISMNTSLRVEVERSKAIDVAIGTATKRDVVLIAGKGHETYQIFDKERIYFDDREQVVNAFKRIIKE